tara:strand:+ start:136 stop:1140 length:1005 start_codon:yes stop_codon:yes gene_type:complete
MARTNFSGPINEGSIQQNNQPVSGAYSPGGTRNVGFVQAGQSFWLDHNAFTITGAAATNVAAAARPASGTMTLTADAATIGTTILPAINGYGGAAQVTITSVADDSSNTLVLTGTDVYGLPQTESLVMADSTTTQSVKTWASITDAQVTLTSSGADQQPAGNVSIGVIATDKMTVLCQSTYNGFPGVGFGTAGYQPSGSYGSLVDSNLANNIVIPKNSRIMNISLITVEDPGQTAAFEFGANLGQASTTDTHDLNYFTTTSASLRAVGQYNLGGAGGAGGLVPDHANCYNTSYGDTNPYAVDKLVTVTCDFGAAITAGEWMINFSYLQGVNATN